MKSAYLLRIGIFLDLQEGKSVQHIDWITVVK